MKIAVCVKHVPEGSSKIDPGTKRLDRSGEGSLNHFDANAVEEALRLKGDSDSEVVVVSLGPEKAADSLRKALAMGADRAVLVTDAAAAGSDLVATSKLLAKTLERENADLVLFGQQASDADGAVLWAAVAERLRQPVVSQAAELGVDGTTIRVKRQTEFGYDVIEAPLPAVVAVRDARDGRPPPRRCRGERRDQRAAVSVPQGDHGREEEAVRDTLARRHRARRRGGRRGGLEDRGARAHRSAVARRLAQDRRRRQRRAGDRRLPRGEAARMSILVFLEHHGNELQKGSLGVLSKAATLGAGDVAAVLVGGGVRALASEAGKFGASKVHVLEDDSLEPPLPQPRVDALAKAVEDGGYDTVLLANSGLAADIGAGLSARLDAGLNWDLVDITSDFTGKRPALQDSVLVDVGWRSTPRIGLFRAGSFDAAATSGGEPQIDDLTVEIAPHAQAAKVVSQEQEQSSGPSIEDADIIVAGGRGLGAPENFTLAEELARALGGAVGATRAVVDAGWYPYAAQIGQTGKVVSPKLYVALGISGAIQHKVGMQSSNVIVAINKDANAPIFEFSDLGVVGDVNEIVPKLTALIEQRKSG